MDHLQIFTGARVADVGAGGGWFTIRLADRVGSNGSVYAEDIQQQMIDLIHRRVEREGKTNVHPILGTPSDPRLPSELNAVLMVDTYPQIREPILLLKSIAASLAPKGKLGIVDFRPDGSGGPGPDVSERISADVIKQQAAAAGLTLVGDEQFLKYQYFLIFGKKQYQLVRRVRQVTSGTSRYGR